MLRPNTPLAAQRPSSAPEDHGTEPCLPGVAKRVRLEFRQTLALERPFLRLGSGAGDDCLNVCEVCGRQLPTRRHRVGVNLGRLCRAGNDGGDTRLGGQP